MPIKRIRLRTAPYPATEGEAPRFSVYPVVEVLSHYHDGGGPQRLHAVYGRREAAGSAAARSSVMGAVPVPYARSKTDMWLTGDTRPRARLNTDRYDSFADWQHGVYGYIWWMSGFYLTAVKENGVIQDGLQLPTSGSLRSLRAAGGKLAVVFSDRALRLELGDSGYTITDTIASHSYTSSSVMADFSGVYELTNYGPTSVDVVRYLFDGTSNVTTVSWPASITGAFTGDIDEVYLWPSGGASGWDMIGIITTDGELGLAGLRVTADSVQFAPPLLLSPGDAYYDFSYAYSLPLRDSRWGEFRAGESYDGFCAMSLDRYAEVYIDASGVEIEAFPLDGQIVPESAHVFGNGRYSALYADGLIIVTDMTTGEKFVGESYQPQSVTEIAPGRWVIGNAYFDGSSIRALLVPGGS